MTSLTTKKIGPLTSYITSKVHKRGPLLTEILSSVSSLSGTNFISRNQDALFYIKTRGKKPALLTESQNRFQT